MSRAKDPDDLQQLQIPSGSLCIMTILLVMMETSRESLFHFHVSKCPERRRCEALHFAVHVSKLKKFPCFLFGHLSYILAAVASSFLISLTMDSGLVT